MSKPFQFAQVFPVCVILLAGYAGYPAGLIGRKDFDGVLPGRTPPFVAALVPPMNQGQGRIDLSQVSAQQNEFLFGNDSKGLACCENAQTSGFGDD